MGLYILQRPSPRRGGSEPQPLGSRAEVLAAFARMNTAPERAGGDDLFGPGIEVQLPPHQDPVMQAAIRVTEEELFSALFLGTEDDRPGKLAKEVRQRGWQLVNQSEGLVYPAVRDEDEFEDDASNDGDAR